MVSALERHDIQGLLMSGYARMHLATYLLLAVREPASARTWLTDLAARVTTGERPQEESCLNVALTPEGLRALGVPDADLRTFPAPLREGMAATHRTFILGDTGASAPQHWRWGGPATEPVHVLLLVFAKDEEAFSEHRAAECRRLEDGGLEVLQELTPEPLPGRLRVGKFGVEHFGFADGMSQPVIEGSGQEDKLGGDDHRRTVIEAGEFVLGYPNGYGRLTPWPRVGPPERGGSDFGRNGSYLVFRQLSQDVAGFWRFVDTAIRRRHGDGDPEERTRLAAKLVGRWPSGAPLVKSHHRDDPDLGTDNSFGYAAWDGHGLRCPLASHIRRTNPRDALGDDPERALELANLHRILRRGRVYGPGLDDPLAGDDGKDRGLFFLCLNANLERQFEFVQHTWCNNPKFAGRYDEQDPLLGNPPPDGGRFTVQDAPVRQRLVGIPSFVTTRGGAYFFLPGIAALRRLGTV